MYSFLISSEFCSLTKSSTLLKFVNRGQCKLTRWVLLLDHRFTTGTHFAIWGTMYAKRRTHYSCRWDPEFFLKKIAYDTTNWIQIWARSWRWKKINSKCLENTKGVIHTHTHTHTHTRRPPGLNSVANQSKRSH